MICRICCYSLLTYAHIIYFCWIDKLNMYFTIFFFFLMIDYQKWLSFSMRARFLYFNEYIKSSSLFLTGDAHRNNNNNNFIIGNWNEWGGCAQSWAHSQKWLVRNEIRYTYILIHWPVRQSFVLFTLWANSVGVEVFHSENDIH